MAKKKLTKRQSEIMDAILGFDFKEQFIDNIPAESNEWQTMRIAVPPVDERVFKNLVSVLQDNWKIAKDLVVVETFEKFVIYNVSISVADWKQLFEKNA